MTNDIPVTIIKENALTESPPSSDATIMDDLIMTMDGSALMAGPFTIIGEIKSKVTTPRPFTVIPRSS